MTTVDFYTGYIDQLEKSRIPAKTAPHVDRFMQAVAEAVPRVYSSLQECVFPEYERLADIRLFPRTMLPVFDEAEPYLTALATWQKEWNLGGENIQEYCWYMLSDWFTKGKAGKPSDYASCVYPKPESKAKEAPKPTTAEEYAAIRRANLARETRALDFAEAVAPLVHKAVEKLQVAGFTQEHLNRLIEMDSRPKAARKDYHSQYRLLASYQCSKLPLAQVADCYNSPKSENDAYKVLQRTAKQVGVIMRPHVYQT